jgi:hypothetical protein
VSSHRRRKPSDEGEGVAQELLGPLRLQRDTGGDDASERGGLDALACEPPNRFRSIGRPEGGRKQREGLAALFFAGIVGGKYRVQRSTIGERRPPRRDLFDQVFLCRDGL